MLDSNQHRRFWRPPCYRLHQCHIPDLVNVQVGKTFGMAGWILPPTARSWSVSTPFHRTSPSVINRLIRAGSLLPSTRPCRVIRAIPSVTQAATPMKPRANLGNRTRQPKGCANRIASQPQKNKWRSHIDGTGWDRHKKRGWTQSHGQSKNTHYIPGFIHPQRVPSRIRTGTSSRMVKKSQKPMRD
mgnify:CR=1 FL=1